MANNDLVFKNGRELAALIKSKKLSPVELTQAYLDRIDQLNPKLNAFITVTKEQALAQAHDARMFIMDKMLQALPEPREDLSPWVTPDPMTTGSHAPWESGDRS